MKEYSPEFRREHNRLKPYEYLPFPVVEDVISNPDIKRSEDPDVKLWSTKDILKTFASVIAKTNNKYDTLLAQAPEMHRGVILQMIDTGKPFFDEYRTPFSQIIGKGTFVTNLKTRRGRGQYEPLGLFGLADAQKDMIGSNLHAQENGRVARTLGIIVLNHGKLRNWTNSLDTDAKIALNNSIDTVVSNGDNAAILIRLSGVERKQELDVAQIKEDQDRNIFDMTNPFSTQRIYQRTANLLLAECKSRGIEEFNDRYNTTLSIREIMQLIPLMNGSFSPIGQDTISRLQTEFEYHNRKITNLISAKYFHGDLKYPGGNHNEDVAGYLYDWELKVPQAAIEKHLPIHKKRLRIPFLS